MSKDRYSWHPATSAQKAALDSRAELLFFGGSAGSLKTETVLMDAAQEISNPNLNAIIFRSSYVEMKDIIKKCKRLYAPLGGEYSKSEYTWTFPSGATIRFAYMGNDDDVWKLLGLELTFIAFDESTRHTEYQVRNAIGRLRCTDPTIRKRVRLASNPGGVGADWHMKLFLNNHCPIHQPEKAAIPGMVYHGKRWPSDGEGGVPIPQSVAFIPGKLSDHNLLGEDYVKNLNQMSSAYAEAMAKGCWCTLEGAYFPFLNRDMVRDISECDIQPWHNHFIAVDYGMGQSHAAAGLFVRSPAEFAKTISIPGIRTEVIPAKWPNGRIRQIGEIVVPMTPVDDFARMVVDGFIATHGEEMRRAIVAVYLDPANFNPDYDLRHGTGGHAVSDQFDRILEPWGLTCQKASNDRPGGWQLLSRMLRDGEFEFTNYSTQTFDALRTRMIDKEKYLDIVKEKGKPEDDLSDMVRYGVYSWVHPADKPRELVLKEATAGIDISTPEGLTSAGIRYQQAAERFDAGDEPIRFGSRRMTGGRRR